jgi:hypothetical protein
MLKEGWEKEMRENTLHLFLDLQTITFSCRQKIKLVLANSPRRTRLTLQRKETRKDGMPKKMADLRGKGFVGGKFGEVVK